MISGEGILKSIDKYFNSANEAEIQSDIEHIESFNSENGTTFEGYLNDLNRDTSYNPSVFWGF